MGAGYTMIGSIAVRTFTSSRFRLDGGSMFGVVPKVLWEKRFPADEFNRIRLAVNTVLVETDGMTVLVEAGMGGKYTGDLSRLYALSRVDVTGGMRRIGFRPEDVDVVILTHLHRDHAGGSTLLSGDKAVCAFPRARFVVQRAEWGAALNPHPLAAASYEPADFEPLEKTGRLELVDGTAEAAPGVWVELTGGHTPGHQIVVIRSGGEEAVYPGDAVPTSAHIKLNWLMSWDLEPGVLYREKSRILGRTARLGSLLFLTHDPGIAAVRLREVKPGSYEPIPGTIVPADG